MLDWLHIVALIKGTYEGDPFAHFGSMLGFSYHVTKAIDLDLIRRGDEAVLLTPSGIDFYEQYGLEELPEGRAANWLSLNPRIVEVATAELERRATS